MEPALSQSSLRLVNSRTRKLVDMFDRKSGDNKRFECGFKNSLSVSWLPGSLRIVESMGWPEHDLASWLVGEKFSKHSYTST